MTVSSNRKDSGLLGGSSQADAGPSMAQDPKESPSAASLRGSLHYLHGHKKEGNILAKHRQRGNFWACA